MSDELTNTMVDLDDLKNQLIEDDGTLSVIEQTVENIPVVNRTIRLSTQSIGNAFTVGHPTNGVVGTATGVGGSQVLVGSSNKGTSTVVGVANKDNEFAEYFKLTDFIDTSAATVDTTTHAASFDTPALTATYVLGSTDTTSAGGVIDTAGANDGTASGYSLNNVTRTSYTPTTARWTLDGDGTDASGNGETLTATNITWTTGKLGDCASFNGSTSLLQHIGLSQNNTVQQTICAWVYPTDLSSSRTVTSYNGLSTVMIETDGRVRFEAQANSTQSGRYWSVNTVPINQWTHIAVVFNGYGTNNQGLNANVVNIYINGVLETHTFTAIGTTASTSTTFNIGAYTSGVNVFQGLIDDVRIYRWLLTQEYINEIYNGGAGNANEVTYTAYVPGVNGGYARRIYGITEYHELATATPADLAFDYTTSFSWSIWVKPYSSGTIQTISSTGLLGRSFQQAIHITSYTGSVFGVAFQLRISSTITGPTVSNLAMDQWHHIVAVYDASSRRAYLHVDGSIDASGVDVSHIDFSNSNGLRLGGSSTGSGNNHGLNAAVDTICFYDRVLTSTEIAQLYAHNIPSYGLIHKYLCDENSGSTINDTYYYVNGPNATYTEAWTFDAAKDRRILISDNAALDITSAGMTWGAWAKVDAFVPASDSGVILWKENEYGLRTESNGGFRVYVRDTTAAAWRSYEDEGNLTGTWYRVIGTFDGSVGKLYINGVLQGSTPTVTGYSASANNFYIGQQNTNTSRQFTGALAGVFVAQRCWSDAEVYADYNGYGVPLVSKSIVLGQGNVTAATFDLDTSTMTPSSASFRFEMTNDGGTTWEEVTPGTEHTFSSTGGDVRYRVFGDDGSEIDLRDANGNDFPILVSYDI